MTEESPTEQINDIITAASDWRGELLAELRAVIRQADPQIVEEVKWKKPSRPQGVPVWARGGNVCIADLLKNAVRLTFPNGAQLADPLGLFNTRLDSKTVRAIDFAEGATIDEVGLTDLVRQAVEQNLTKTK